MGNEALPRRVRWAHAQARTPRSVPIRLLLALLACFALFVPALAADPVPFADLRLLPYRSETYGIQALAPAGWIETAPGLFIADTDTRLFLQALPRLAPAELRNLLEEQYGLGPFPAPMGQLSSNALSWDLYLLERPAVGGGRLLVDVALSAFEQVDSSGQEQVMGYLVVLQAREADFLELHHRVFLPVVAAFAPLSLP